MTAREKVSRSEQDRRWAEFLEKHQDEINLPREERERRWAVQSVMLSKDEEPLLAALTAAGWPPEVRQCGKTRSVWDFVNTVEPYPHLLDTMAEHLVRPYHKRIKEGIARALAVKEARGTHVPRVLMDELKKQVDPNEGPNSYRWVLINTLMTIGDSALLEDARQLIDDPRYALVHPDLEKLARKMSRKRSDS